MKKICILTLLLLLAGVSHAQLLKYDFDEKGETYIRATLRGQFWLRYTETNPGTTVNGEPTSQALDFSVRRYRMGLQAQVNPKLFFFMLMGGNNINQRASRPYHIRLLDLYAEYTFNDAISVGVGKLSWGGPGRYTIFSNASMLNLDPTIFELFTLDHADDFGRNLGMYAKGQVNKFDYTVSLQTPVMPTDAQVASGYAKNRPRVRFSSYLKYEFLENESNKNPFSGGVGTYLGTKKILNLGIGYVHQAKMMQKLIAGTTDQYQYYDHSNLGIDLFYDSPISAKNEAITTYFGYNRLDFGPDYVRNLAANSIFDSAGTSFNGGGNAFPIVGTGNIFFFQFGYLLAKSEKNNIRFQPNIGVKISDFDNLNQTVNVYDAGLNVYFNGQRSKLSFGYQNRPVFDAATLKVNERKGMYVLQYQIEL
ncbi:MAG: hypothetical protein Q4G08_08675 [Capnocytophaga sp.]|nr:hypothetical protein [Capnocytophaga sp.]